MTSAFDLIVVGAGPGGSNAAAVALQHGLSVAQVDRYKFPRVKPCGGGVTIKSCKAMRYDLLAALRCEFNDVEVNALESGRIAGETSHDYLAGTVRYEAYYRRLRTSVLADTFITYHLSRRFYRNVGKAVTVLEKPFVWRPLVRGYTAERIPPCHCKPGNC